MRCAQCGENNSDTATECHICHSPMKSYRRVILTNPSPPVQANPTSGIAPNYTSAPAIVSPGATPASAPKSSQAVANLPSKVTASPQNISTTPLPKRNQIQGRVIFVGQVEHHPENCDWYALTSRFMWFGLLVLSPFLLLYAILVKTGILTGLLIGFVTTGVGGFFLLWLFKKNPFAFIQTFFMVIQSGLMAALFRRGPAPTVPVRTLRIRDKTQQQEVSVTIRGHFSSGDIIVDDEVTIWGSWSNGNVVFARGINQRTGSHIMLRIPRSKTIFWITILIFAVVALSIYGSVSDLLKQIGH
jgi:hypothetical protein